MKITDLDGKEITVTDLDEAIAQADSMRQWEHDPPAEGDQERKKYWQDIYDKLIQLKKTNS